MNTLAMDKRCKSPCLFAVIVVVMLAGGISSSSFATDAKQKSYSSPEEAVSALVSAVRADNEEEMMLILGPGGKELISSGDEAADRAGRGKFLKAYGVMNRIEKVSPEKAVLHVGKDDWAMPIPLVERDKRWVFDTKAGKEEILDRRIGRNELNVIDVLHACVAAQYAYAEEDRGAGGCGQFAQRIISTPGKHDGLYWVTKEGEKMSPLGPLVAQAAQEGYTNKTDGMTFSPYHGYYFRILKGQGKYAQGGAYDCVVKGKMILGFGFVAYPAQYGNSGVMTFIVNQEGIIYEKNFGSETARIAEAIKVFNPDKTWKKVEEKQK
ncbi:MAG: DUF2950 domain-containing protein [Candidatus Sulfobium sp.]